MDFKEEIHKIPFVKILLPLIALFIVVRYTNNVKIPSVKNNGKFIMRITVVIFSIFLLITPLIFVQNQTITPDQTDSFGVMTYNIQYGINSDGEYNPEEIADYIINSGVSIVGLQEVMRGSLLDGNGGIAKT